MKDKIVLSLKEIRNYRFSIIQINDDLYINEKDLDNIEKLRLKGFYDKGNKNCKELNDFDNFNKYLKENCAFDCSYFVAKRK